MPHNLVRTQMYFPKELKDEIERQSRWDGKSMAQFVREGMEEKVKVGRKKKKALKKLADDYWTFAKSNKNSGWTEEAIAQWRKERREEDEYMEKRLDEAWKQAGKKR